MKFLTKVDTTAAKKNLKTIGKMLRLIWQIRPYAAVTYAVGAILEICSFVVTMYASAKIGGELARYAVGKPTGQIWFWLGAGVLGGAGITVGVWCMNAATRLIFFRFTSWGTEQFIRIPCRLDIQDLYDEKLRTKIDQAADGYTWQIPNFAESCLTLVYGVMRLLVTAAIVIGVAWWVLPLIALFLVPGLLIESKLAKIQWFVWNDKGDERHMFWTLAWQIRQAKSQMEMRSAQAREYVEDKLNSLNSQFYEKQEKRYLGLTKYVVPAKIIAVGGTTIGSVITLQRFIVGSLSLTNYFFISGALMRLGSSMENVFGTLSRMQELLLFNENFFELMKLRPKIVDKKHAKTVDPTQAPEIVFDNVSFVYPGHKNQIFKNLNLTIKAGTHVALVGENGAGKSTLIKLLLRFYRPTSGKILVNNVDLQDVTIESWYDCLATLFQDFNQYPLSIKENIEIGKSRFAGDEKRLEQAAGFGGVNKFLGKLPYGWETVLDNSFKKGTEPSGGQWQRVALARAFYRHANAIILDEPTAAIDANAEYEIFNNIFEHYSGKTAIIVSHRFSTVRRADTICVIDDGKIIEQGSHAKLMKQKGLYHELFTKQAEGYKE